MDSVQQNTGHRPSPDAASSSSASVSPIHRHASTSTAATSTTATATAGPSAFTPSSLRLSREASPLTPQAQPLKDSCDRNRNDEEINPRLVKMPSELVGKTVSPFLKEHIPGLYAPLGIGKGKQRLEIFDDSAIPSIRKRDPNSKFCYRHRPDSKCRRAADETKMGFIQSVSAVP